MSIEGVRFLGGVELADGRLILAGYDSTVDMSSDPHTLLIAGKPDELEEVAHTPWLSVCAGANAAGDALVLVSRYGRYLEYGLDGHRAGVVDDDGEIEYRSVDVVGDHVFASGGSGTIRCLGEDSWVDESEGLSGGNLIEAVAGFSREELYGFGWSGEIWLRDKGAWRQVDSPTDLLLQAATVVGDRVFAAGQLGVILEGRRDSWEVRVEDGGADIWSVVEFEGVPYFSSIKGIQRLTDGGLEEMDTSALEKTTRLFSGPGGVWSLGGGTLGLFDGKSWRCVVKT